MKRTRWLAVLVTAFGIGFASGSAIAQDDAAKSSDLFKSLDKNSDGKLTGSEVSEEQKRFFDRLVRVGDSDGNGELTRSEFDKATSPNAGTPAPPSDRRPDARRPGDGRPGDSRPGQPGSNRSRDPKEFFKRLDRNADGKVTLEEIPEAARSRMKPLFDRIGKTEVTLQDLLKLRPATSDRRPEGQPSRRPGDSTDKRPTNSQDRRPGDMPRPGSGQMPAFFRELDQNRDGALSREELERAASLIKTLDRNSNGKLEIFELFAGRGSSDRPGGSRSARPQRPGDRPVTDKQSTSENRQESSDVKSSRSRVSQGFGRLDRNGDGFLSRDEAPGRLKENFGRVDKNGDGKISSEEIRALASRTRD